MHGATMTSLTLFVAVKCVDRRVEIFCLNSECMNVHMYLYDTFIILNE